MVEEKKKLATESWSIQHSNFHTPIRSDGGNFFMHRIIYLMAFLLGIMLPVAVSWSDNHWKSLLPDGDGKDMTAQLCGTMCHNLQKTVVSKKDTQRVGKNRL